MNVEALLQSIPPLAVYLVVGGVVGIESLGIPLPGEIVLVSAALMSSHHDLAVNPLGVGTAAVIGALAGALNMPSPGFLAATFSGGIWWGGGPPALVYFAGRAADRWMERFSWLALVIAVVCGITAAILLRERTSRAIAELEAEHYRKT